MNVLIATGQDDDIPGIIESIYANASLAAGTSNLMQEAYKSFCKDLDRLEVILRAKGVLKETTEGNEQ
jgi:hypothetical protein